MTHNAAIAMHRSSDSADAMVNKRETTPASYRTTAAME
jgi:hypothetical protein